MPLERFSETENGCRRIRVFRLPMGDVVVFIRNELDNSISRFCPVVIDLSSGLELVFHVLVLGFSSLGACFISSEEGATSWSAIQKATEKSAIKTVVVRKIINGPLLECVFAVFVSNYLSLT